MMRRFVFAVLTMAGLAAGLPVESVADELTKGVAAAARLLEGHIKGIADAKPATASASVTVSKDGVVTHSRTKRQFGGGLGAGGSASQAASFNVGINSGFGPTFNVGFSESFAEGIGGGLGGSPGGGLGGGPIGGGSLGGSPFGGSQFGGGPIGGGPIGGGFPHRHHHHHRPQFGQFGRRRRAVAMPLTS